MATIRTTYKYACDLDKGTYEVNLRNALMQADAQADAFRVSVTRNGADVAVSGMNAYGYLYVAANQTTIALKGTVSGNTAEVVLTSDCYAVPGYASLVIQLHEGGVRHTVLKVNMHIERTGGNRVLTGGDVLPTLTEVLDKISAMEQATATANATIATIKADTAAAIKATNEATAATQTATVELAKTAGVPVVLAKTGSIVTITDGAERPAVQVISHIEPVQEGSGDPSPDNVRPISGWDSVTAQRTGENLLSPEMFALGTLLGGGAEEVSSSRLRTGFIPVKPGQRYSLLAEGLLLYEVFLFDGNKLYIEQKSVSATQYTFATASSAKYIRVLLRREDNATLDLTTITHIQMVEGDVPADKLPYSYQTLTASLPETVYGGTLDWGAGVLTVTHEKYVADGTAKIFSAPNAKYYYRIGIRLPKASTAYNIGNNVCDRIAYNADVFFDTYDNVGFCVHSGILHIRFGSDSGLTTTDTIVTYLTENPMTFAYQLAEPYTIQLTPQQLSTLKGTNNVWSDTGDTDLTYIADTQLYIDNKFNELQSAFLSTGANV